MIELSFSIWHVWALIYALSCFCLLFVCVVAIIDSDDGWGKWLELALAFVWPIAVPALVYFACTRSVREIQGRLRAEGQYLAFQQWAKEQKAARANGGGS